MNLASSSRTSTHASSPAPKAHLHPRSPNQPVQDNRTSYVRAKVRHEYDAHALEADPTKVTFLLRLAETQLDQVREQASHLAKVFSDPGVHARF